MGEPKGEEFDPTLAIRKGLPNSIPETKARSDYTEHEDALKQLKNIKHVEVVDPIKHLCKNGLCKTRDEKAFFYRDYNHMRPWYSIKANSYLDAIFLT